MTQKDRIISVLRHLLSAFAGYVFIKGLASLGNAQLVGIVLFVAAIILCWKAKVLIRDVVNGICRHIVSFIGGVIVALTPFDITSKQSIVGLLLIIAAIIMSQLTPRNVNQVMITAANGDLYKISEKAQPITNTGLPSAAGS